MRSGARKVKFEDIYPLLDVCDDVAVNAKGTLTIGWEITFPTVYTAEEDDYDDILATFAAAIRRLPEWTVVHRQDIYLYDEYGEKEKENPSFLGERYRRHFQGRRHLTHKSYVFVTLCSKGLVEKPGKLSGIFGINGKYAEVESRKFEAFQIKCRQFSDIWESCGKVKLRKLTEADWLGEGDTVGIVQKYMMLGSESPIVSDIACGPEHVEVFDKRAMAFAVNDARQLPGEISSVARVESLSANGNDIHLSLASKIGVLLDCDHVVNQIIVVPSQAEFIKGEEDEKKKMTSSLSSTDNRLNAEEIQEFLDEAYRNGLYLCQTHMNVIAWGDESERMSIFGKLQAALTGMQVEASYNKNDTPVLWYAGTPSAAFEIGDNNLMKQELYASLCLEPYEKFDTGLGGGMLQICDRMRNIPIYLDTQLYAQKLGHIDNYNAFILGPSGSGKSYFMNHYLRNCYDYGEDVFVIDVGDSYEGQCHIVYEQSGGKDGQYYAWTDDDPLTFNPFTNYRNWVDERGVLRQIYGDTSSGVGSFISILQYIWQPKTGWTPDLTNILKQTVSDFIKDYIDNNREETNGLPIMDDYYRYLSDIIRPLFHSEQGYMIDKIPAKIDRFDIDAFILALQSFSMIGEYSFLLNEKHPKDIYNSRFVVFEVQKLSQDNSDAGKRFYSICVLCIMNAFETKMYSKKDGFKVMVIEEAWKAIANETMAPFLSSLWKTSRKYSVQAMVVTQQLKDIMGSDVIKDTILQNSSVRMLLDPKGNQNNLDDIIHYMGLTERAKRMVVSLNKALNPNYLYREVFIALGATHYGVYATEVSDAEVLAYESRKEEKKPMLSLAKKINSYINAIMHLTGEKNYES